MEVGFIAGARCECAAVSDSQKATDFAQIEREYACGTCQKTTAYYNEAVDYSGRRLKRPCAGKTGREASDNGAPWKQDPSETGPFVKRASTREQRTEEAIVIAADCLRVWLG
jgi:hypothetical protein